MGNTACIPQLSLLPSALPAPHLPSLNEVSAGALNYCLKFVEKAGNATQLCFQSGLLKAHLKFSSPRSLNAAAAS